MHLTELSTLKGWIDSPPLSGVSSVTPRAGALGSGYTHATATVTDALGSGSGAAVTPVIVGGQITSYVVSAKGQNYSSPQIVVSGDGVGAAADAAIGADAYLSRLITAASAVIVEALSIETIFDSGANITEVRNGNGRDRMVMNVSPIASVASVKIGIITLSPSDGVSPGYLFGKSPIDNDILYLIGRCFERGVQNVTVVYRAGETLGSRRQALLEQACLVSCALWWKRRPHVAEISINVPQVGNLTFSQKDLPAEAWTIINQIRRVVPVE